MTFRASALSVAATFMAAGCEAASEASNSGGALVEVRLIRRRRRVAARADGSVASNRSRRGVRAAGADGAVVRGRGIAVRVGARG